MLQRQADRQKDRQRHRPRQRHRQTESALTPAHICFPLPLSTPQNVCLSCGPRWRQMPACCLAFGKTFCGDWGGKLPVPMLGVGRRCNTQRQCSTVALLSCSVRVPLHRHRLDVAQGLAAKRCLHDLLRELVVALGQLRMPTHTHTHKYRQMQKKQSNLKQTR